MLDEANSSCPNIKLFRQIGKSVSFLDLFIENEDGTLITSVFHKQAAESYIVPFKSDHPQQIFKNVIDAALKRAVQYSSTLSAFHAERRSIKLMLLYNGYMFLFLHNCRCLFSKFSYPPRYLYDRFYQFFPSHLSISAVLPTTNTENDFARIRYLLLNRPTIPEYQTASRLVKAIKNNPTEEINDPLVKTRLNKQSKFDNNLIIHCTYEKRLQSNKNAIHQLWHQTFEQTPVMNTRLIIGNQNSRNMTQDLIHRRQIP
jgi:hypothetical protein